MVKLWLNCGLFFFLFLIKQKSLAKVWSSLLKPTCPKQTTFFQKYTASSGGCRQPVSSFTASSQHLVPLMHPSIANCLLCFYHKYYFNVMLWNITTTSNIVSCFILMHFSHCLYRTYHLFQLCIQFLTVGSSWWSDLTERLQSLSSKRIHSSDGF